MEYPEQQFLYDDLLVRWNKHFHRSSPRGLGGREVAGVCLVMLDAGLFELVDAFLKHRELAPRAINVLRQLHEDVRRVLPSLSGESAEYFEEWEEIASGTLRLADPREG